MVKRLFMYILNLFFSRRPIEPPLRTLPKKILVIRTDERLGEIILTLPLINHLKKAFPDAEITFLMCKQYSSLSRYIGCDNFIFFEKRWLFLNPPKFIGFMIGLLIESYDLVIPACKISLPSLTAYLLAGLARGRVKAAILQNSFNPFVDIRPVVETISEPFSKHMLGMKLTGVPSDFDNSLKCEGEIRKSNDILIFLDGRKKDHLVPDEVIRGLIERLLADHFSITVASGLHRSERIERLRIEYGDRISYAESYEIDRLVEEIRRSRSVICGNTGVLHLSVALRVLTVGLFVKADPLVWGYNFSPHLMIDLRNTKIDVEELSHKIKGLLR